MAEMDFVFLLALALSVVTLIFFFKLCLDVSKLKERIFEFTTVTDKSSLSIDKLINAAEKDIYIGNVVECKKYLLTAKYTRLKYVEKNTEDYMKKDVDEKTAEIKQIDELLSQIK